MQIPASTARLVVSKAPPPPLEPELLPLPPELPVLPDDAGGAGAVTMTTACEDLVSVAT
jgi:hypothetical protein